MLDFYMKNYVSALTIGEERKALVDLLYEVIREVKLLRLDVDELRKLNEEELQINA